MLLRVVGSCCGKFETGQTVSYVETDTTTPNNVESCWPTIVRPFARSLLLTVLTLCILINYLFM